MQQELNAVKGALEQVVHTLDYWDQPQGVQGQGTWSHVAQVSANQQGVAVGPQTANA